MSYSEPSRARGLLLNLSLSLVSVLCILMVTELVFRTQLHHMPLRFHVHLKGCERYLAQSSKASLMPVDYVALLGDSYAQGYGDALMTANDWRNPGFGSQHVLANLLGKDVLSLGIGGHGSFAGMVSTPLNALRCLQARYDVREPDAVVVYFYAGNDLENNLSDLVRFGQAADSVLADYAAFEALAEAQLKQYEARPSMRPRSASFFAWLAVSVFTQKRPSKSTPWPEGETNRVIIDGQSTAIPDTLQAPALGLTEAELTAALKLFEHSLRFLVERQGREKVLMVYVPAPLESYRVVSKQVSTQRYFGRLGRHDSELLRERSDWLAAQVNAVSTRLGVAFVDARPAIRKAALSRRLHGPLDWKHFNRHGYRLLAEVVAARVKTLDGLPQSQWQGRHLPAAGRPVATFSARL